MPPITINISRLIRYWKKTLPSRCLSTDPIVYTSKLKEIRTKAFKESDPIEIIGVFVHELFRGGFLGSEPVFFAFYAAIFLMDDNQQGIYQQTHSVPLHIAFQSVKSAIKWIKDNHNLETF